jgi:hypothetical protein
MNRFTDRDMFELYDELSARVASGKKNNFSNEAIREELEHTFSALYFYGGNRFTSLYPDELNKASRVFYEFMDANGLSVNRIQAPQAPQAPRQFTPASTPPPTYRTFVRNHYQRPPRCYHHNDNFWFWMYFFNNNNRPTYVVVDRPARPSEENKGDPLLAFILGAALLGGVILAAAAAYSVFKQLSDVFQRFYYNEGWMQASLSLLTLAVSITATAMIMTAAFGASIASFAVAAGFAPTGVVVLSTICASLLAAALILPMKDWISNSMNSSSNPDALIPNDPCRFQLTSSEEQALMKKGQDPLVVKCAITALALEIKKETPTSIWNALFKPSSPHLETIRKLRQGELRGRVQVGDATFDIMQKVGLNSNLGRNTQQFFQ